MRTTLRTIASFVGVLLVPAAHAAVMYDAGALNFESTNQSMWGSGSAYVNSNSVFVGTQWSNKTATIGGIAGDANTVIIPGTNDYTIRWFEPRINLGFTSIGCGCTRSKTIAGIPPVTADTRTGAEINLHTSGKVGLEFGYTIDSGSINTTANFNASAIVPDQIQAAQYFSLNTASVLGSGTIQSQSPKVEAYMSAIMQLSGSIDAQACLVPFGCSAKGTAALPTIDLNQRILSVDPNSIKVLDGAGPGGAPIAETTLFNQSLTLEGGLSATLVPGFKLTTLNGAATIVNTMPPVPSVTADMAELTVQLPDIATSGSGSNAPITSSGRDDVLSAQVDLDGMATMFAGLPPTGLNFDLIDTPVFKIGASLDLIDVDAGPVLGLAQDFEFSPTLMTTINFSNPVEIAGMIGPQTSWTGKWSDLPAIAISQTTTANPVFWIDAFLTNNMGLDLGLEGTMDLLKLGATASVGGIDVLGLNPLSLNNLLGLDNTLFSTDKLLFDIFSDTFGLGGFDQIQGSPILLALATDPGQGGNLVPEPGTLWLALAVLIGWGATQRRGRAGSTPGMNGA